MDIKTIGTDSNKNKQYNFKEDTNMDKYLGVLNNEELSNMDRKALKVDIMRNLPRVTFNNATILVTSEDETVGVAYVYADGSIHRAVKGLDGNWSYNEGTCYCNTTSKYKWTELPMTKRYTGTAKGLQVGAHVIAGVVLGLYDNVDIDMLRVYELNHKNWICDDNRPVNMEVVTKGDNTNHRVLKQLLIDDGSYVEGMSFEAKVVTDAMKSAKGDIAYMKRLLNVVDGQMVQCK